MSVASYIRIVRTPLGEAPLWVREKWVGLELPLEEDTPITIMGFGVLSAPEIRNQIDYLMARATGKIVRMTGYVVSVDAALAILAEKSSEAATWWRENTPHMLGQNFIFDEPACEPMAGLAR
jgi:hypothetical protein